MLDFITEFLAPLFDAFNHKNGWHVFFAASIVFVIVAIIAWLLATPDPRIQ